MKDSLRNTFPLNQKKAFNDRSLEKIYKKWFVLARKPVSTTWNKTFVEKYFSHGKKLLLLTRKSKKMVSPSTKIYFFWNRCPLIWIMASNSRKKFWTKEYFWQQYWESPKKMSLFGQKTIKNGVSQNKWRIFIARPWAVESKSARVTLTRWICAANREENNSFFK